MRLSLTVSALLVICLGCRAVSPDPTAARFTGEWRVCYLPVGREAAEYAMEEHPLPSSATPEIAPFTGTLLIKAEGDRLRFDGYTGQVTSGGNDALKYQYVIGQKVSEWGVSTVILYPSSDGRIYGSWSRLFWGRSDKIPPMVSMERFVLERIGD